MFQNKDVLHLINVHIFYYYAQLENAHPQNVLKTLIFVMLCTRPNIAFSVSCLAQYFSAPRALQWEQGLRCFGYLVGTCNFGILLSAVAWKNWLHFLTEIGLVTLSPDVQLAAM